DDLDVDEADAAGHQHRQHHSERDDRAASRAARRACRHAFGSVRRVVGVGSPSVIGGGGAVVTSDSVAFSSVPCMVASGVVTSGVSATSALPTAAWLRAVTDEAYPAGFPLPMIAPSLRRR